MVHISLYRTSRRWGLPDAKTLSHIYDYWDEYFDKKENRNERNHVFAGITFTTSLGVSAMFGGGRSRYVTIPDCPTMLQKVIVFILVQAKIAEFARKENQWSGYAFSWLNAREIFSW